MDALNQNICAIDPYFDLIIYQLLNSKHVLVGLVTYTSEFRGADLAL